jgi:large subunit ribosomal protein L25
VLSSSKRFPSLYSQKVYRKKYKKIRGIAVDNFTIEVAERADLGKGACNRCRKAGFIPAVAYHRADQPIAIQVPYKDFTMLAKRARLSQVFTFKSESKALDGRAAIVKEVQQDYVKGKVLHVDFQTLKDDEEITVDIPVVLEGEAPGVKVDKGILTLVTHEVAVTCLPKNIPTQIRVDISSLGLGESIHASDLQLGAGVALADDEHETIVSVVAPRGADEAPAAEAAAPAEAAKAGAKPAAKPAGK